MSSPEVTSSESRQGHVTSQPVRDCESTKMMKMCGEVACLSAFLYISLLASVAFGFSM